MDARLIWSVVVILLVTFITAFFGMNGPEKIKEKMNKRG